MTPAPTTPTRRPQRRGANSTPARRPTIAEAFQGRSTTRRKASNDLHDRAAVEAELRREATRLSRESEESSSPFESKANNNIQNRIRQWQSQGGGVVEQPLPRVRSTESSKVEEEVPRLKRDIAPVGDTTNRRRKRTSKDAEDSPRSKAKNSPKREESKSSTNTTTPKRRVLSDSHWRKNAGPAKESPKPRENIGSGEENAVHTTPRSANAARPAQKDFRSPKPTLDSEGIRVYKTPERRTRQAELKNQSSNRKESSGSRSDKHSYQDGPSSRTTPTPPKKADSTDRRRKPARNSFKMSGGLDEKDLPKTKSPVNHPRETPEKVNKSSPQANSDERLKKRSGSRRTSLLKDVYDESKKIFQRPEQNTPPRPPPGNRIEAWLDGTPDPFVDEDGPLARNDSTLPADSSKLKEEPAAAEQDESPSTPVRRRTRERKNARRSASQEIPGSGASRPLSKQRSSSEKPDLGKTEATRAGPSKESPGLSSPTLKRAGARRRGDTPQREKERSKSVGRDDKGIRTPPRQPDVPIDRPPPPPYQPDGGHELSTIASAESLTATSKTERSSAEADGIPDKATFDAGRENMDVTRTKSKRATGASHASTGENKTQLKRQLTNHADLMSVLSLPGGRSKSIKSARSIRTSRSKLSKATVDTLLGELMTDESKYMRELNTLVDGVIPVLLSCVLSKSDSAIAAGLFNSGNKGNVDVTRPIVDMGIALEKLKNAHKKIPLHEPDQLLGWANRTHRAYSDYIKSYRLGFQDVVVNLAPAEVSDPAKRDTRTEDGLSRNDDGDVVDGDGEKVDVAFLLRRPLVRVKYLAKTVRGFNQINGSPFAGDVSEKFQTLVADARRRSNEERARLEDEAAANVDATRARDLRTLAPSMKAEVEPNRHVKARDVFSLALQHSSGQRVDCKVELLLRDTPKTEAAGGDMLICEIDSNGKWLLFPPVTRDRLSARDGDKAGEMVVMIRGFRSGIQEWHELLVLHSGDDAVTPEWIQMLGEYPVPPTLMRTSSFLTKSRQAQGVDSAHALVLAGVSSPEKSRSPSPHEIEVPIGETLTTVDSKSQHGDINRRKVIDGEHERGYHTLKEGVRTSRHKKVQSAVGPDTFSQPTTPQRRLSYEHYTPKSLNEAMDPTAHDSDASTRKLKSNRKSRQSPAASPVSRLSGYLGNLFKGPSSPRKDAYGFEEVGDDRRKQASPVLDHRDVPAQHGSQPTTPTKLSKTDERSAHPQAESRPALQTRTSLMPSDDLPAIPKARKPVPTPSPGPTAAEELLDQTPRADRHAQTQPRAQTPRDSGPPEPPPHRSQNSSPVNGLKTPKLAPSPSEGDVSRKRRSSSPLKHQYEPGQGSESSSESESSDSDSDSASSASSLSDEDEEIEDGGDVPTPLLPVGALHRYSKTSAKQSMYSQPNGTLTPSQSASQAPFRHVPTQPMKSSKTIASIYSWSDQGRWDQLHPDECSIVVSPGMISAFEMSAAHSQPSGDSPNPESAPAGSKDNPNGPRPLVQLELTPLVPLRRGTALDISIRSPPTAESQLKTGNNVMFRSRNPEECESLYGLINTARINNPTYIALQNARGPYGDGYGTGMKSRSQRSSWFGLGTRRRNSYRASANRTSSVAQTESSVGSVGSAFSALMRFGTAGSRFNIARSTIGSRHGDRPASLCSSSSNSSFARAGQTPQPPQTPQTGSVAPETKNAPIGLTNAKIRLYQRETASKWRDMGSARLTITRPPPGFDRYGLSGDEKRILVKGKTADEILLDVCLGESCFERVARTGIALSVWEEIVGPNGEVGQVGAVGGIGGKTRVYMIQMKSEAETAYTFSLVGKLRY